MVGRGARAGGSLNSEHVLGKGVVWLRPGDAEKWFGITPAAVEAGKGVAAERCGGEDRGAAERGGGGVKRTPHPRSFSPERRAKGRRET